MVARPECGPRGLRLLRLVAQREEDVAVSLIVEPRGLVLLVEDVVQRGLYQPVARHLHRGPQVDELIAVQFVVVGGIVVARIRDGQARPRTVAPEGTIDIELEKVPKMTGAPGRTNWTNAIPDSASA